MKNHDLFAVDGHADLHSEHGPNRGEHSGRSVNPTIKVTDLAWLEFEKPDLDRAETFARAFGFAVAAHGPKTLHLRGSLPGTPAVVIRKGARSRFIGPTFKAADASDLHTLAWVNNRRVEPLDEPGEGQIVRLCDPNGITVGVYHGRHDLPALPEQRVHTLNFGSDQPRINSTQRPPSEPAQVQRLGHLVMQTPHFRRSLNWYLDTLGLIVSDFQYVPGQRDRGPALAFMRCDRGTVPSDHHTLALNLGPATGYMHSAYQVTDLDAVAAPRVRTRLGHGPPHSGQSDLRLLARSRQDDGRALHRRRPVRQHRRSWLGSYDRVRTLPVGAAGQPKLFGYQTISTDDPQRSQSTA